MVYIAEQILRAQPYQAGKPIAELAREAGLPETEILKLASNENPLGMSPLAQARAASALTEAALYPDANGFALKQALSERFDVPPEWITLGSGSNDILELVASTFLSPGKSAVFSQYAFIVYAQATLRVGADGIVVPAAEYGHDLDAMLAAIRPDTTVVFIANPNNPTGTYLSFEQLDTFIAQVPPQVLVVLDEAYNEYLPPALRQDSVAWVRARSNVMITRTFSKAYGLAGLRVGYAISQPDAAEYMNRIRQPFNVNTIAQAAAIGALEDDAFRTRTYDTNLSGLAQLSAGLAALGIPFVKPHGNFILARFGTAAAAAINQFLLLKGIIVRPVTGYGLSEWLRISVGLEHENQRVLTALADYFKQQEAQA